MRVKEIYLLLFAVFVMCYGVFLTDFSFAESFIIGFQIYLVLKFVNNIGYTICFFDFLCFYSVLDTLLMPMMGYRIYNRENWQALSWGWYMRVPEAVYYSYLIPANLALFAGVNILIRKFDSEVYKNIINKLSLVCRDKANIGIALTIIGIISSLLSNITSALSFVFYLLAMLKYIGPIYIFFSVSPLRKPALFLSLLSFFIEGILKGMFGEFVMYAVLILIVISIKFNLNFFTKLSVFVVGLFFIIILQSIKTKYRAITWHNKSVQGISEAESGRVGAFGDLFYRGATNYKLFDSKAFFTIYARMNQGFLISRVMNYVPRVEPYAEGTTVVRALGGILVPRILWPDKPEAGGAENLARFMGIKRKLSYSMNIGPYGEAYGNFGPFYGVIFIFGYGLLLSLAFRLVINSSITHPTLLLWLPVLFFSTLTVETDILSTLNAFFKAYLFILFLFWVSKRFFKASL